MNILQGVLNTVNNTVLVYFVCLNTVYFLTAILAFKHLLSYRHHLRLVDTQNLLSLGNAPGIGIIAPAYNEEATCVEAIKALLNLQYAHFDILVINDGSKDQTLQVLKEAFELQPVMIVPYSNIPTARVKQVYKAKHFANLWVIDKENGGKADALNVGINHCQHPLFCAIDADTLIERDALLRVARPFLEDQRTVATGGMIRIINDCELSKGQVTRISMPRNIWAAVQVLEYFRAFLIARVGWHTLNGLLIISGAFGLFDRALAAEVGGYEVKTVGEDMELVVRMHDHCIKNQRPYKIAFVPDPVAWTECPEDLKVLSRQRERWQRGLTEVMMKYKHMLFNPKYGVLGLFVFPYFFILETLGVFFEFLGYISLATSFYLGYLSPGFMVAFLTVGIVMGLFLSCFSLVLEELVFHRYHRLRDFFKLIGIAFFENIGYRQLSSYWRFKGTLKPLLGIKGTWGKMTRKGFQSKTSAGSD